MFRLKYLEAKRKKLNYILMDIWKKLCEKDLKFYLNLQDDVLYKNYQKYKEQLDIVKELYNIELEIYNLNQVNEILLTAHQDKLDKVVDVINVFYIHILENKKKALQDKKIILIY